MSIKVVGMKCGRLDSVTIQSLNHGDAFVGRVNNGNKRLYLRTFSGLVDLQEPGCTWGNASTLRLTDVKMVDLEIHIKERDC